MKNTHAQKALPKAVANALRVCILASLAVPALAQQPAQKVDKIEVTGSNIKRVDAETSSAVQVLTKEDIEKSGVQTVAELLRAVPAIAGGSLQDFDGGSGFSRATQSASLRGLGSIGTLILLNGRRVAPAANADPNTGQGQSYNLNTIPLSAIERIEILKDGASAIYGADAIAGVINFILKKDYTGAEMRVTGGSSLDNTFRNYTVTGTAGFGDLAKDRFNVLISGEIFHRDPVNYNEPNGVLNDDYRRLNSRNALTSTLSTIPNFYREAVLGNGVFTTTLATDPRCPAANRVSANSGCRANAFDYINIQNKADRGGFIAKGTMDFSSTLQGTAEFSFTRAKNYFTDSPPTLDGTGNGSIWFNAAGQRFQYKLQLPVGHPDNTFTVPVGVRYRFADLGLTYTTTTNDASRVLLGLTGNHFNWDWESAFLYSKTEREEIANGRLFLPALITAINNATYRLGATNNSASVIAGLNPYRTGTGETDIKSWDIKGSRELMNLAGGPLVLAVGAEIRRESFDITSDPQQVAGNFVGIASTTVGASRDVESIFAELSAPIIKNVETQLAVRHDHYSDYGNSTTPKVGIKWKPINTLALRANYGEAFRTPSLTQTSNSRVQSFSTITDPVRCPNGVTPLPGGDSTDCTGRTVASIFLPSTGLEPERSKSFSYGFIWSPLSNLSIQSELWEIRRRSQIDRFSAQQVINNEFTPGYTGGSVVRSSNPASFLTNAQGQPIPGTGPLESTTRRFLNLGETRVKGVDLEFNGSHRLGEGKVSLNALATWMIRYDYQLVKGGPFVNGAGNFYLFETPRLRGNATVDYARGDWSVFARLNYTGGWDYNDPTVASGCYLAASSAALAFMGQCKVRPWQTLDLGGRYNITKALTVSGVIRNVENKNAPYDPNQTTLGFNPTYHNPYGANGSFTVTYKFK
ncbi:MAG: TonB-dependent receptor [Betaproteobacteria bacterium]|nr:TonB-dependent receptor [Betaproteobacteria bacterium]